MNNPIILIKDNQIIFRSDVNIVDAGTGVELPLHHRLTKFGLVIPLTMRPFSLFHVYGMMLNDQNVNTDVIEHLDQDLLTNQLALLIDKFGKMYIMSKFIFSPFRFIMNYVPHGDDIKLAVTSNEIQNDICYSALENSDTLEVAFDVICNVEPITSRYKYRSYKISELTTWVADCIKNGKVEPFTGYSEPVLKD